MHKPRLIAAACALALAAAPAPAVASAGTALQDQLNGALARTLGPHRAYVVANVITNRNRVRAQRLTYGPRGTALQSGYAGASASGAGWGFSRRAGSSTWAHNQRLTTTVFAPGAVRRIRLALVVDVKLPRRTVGRLRTMVASLAGLNRARGDRITVTRLPLAATAAAPARTGMAALLGRRRTLGAALGALLALGVLAFLLIARRDLLRGRATSG
jgi:flagellar M-ring YscJ/FliF-like protein